MWFLILKILRELYILDILFLFGFFKFLIIRLDSFLISLILTKSPYFPLFKISLGPDLQSVDIIGILKVPASTNTLPKPSYIEVRTKRSAIL